MKPPGGRVRGKSEAEGFAWRKWYEQPQVFMKLNQLGPTTRPAPGISKRWKEQNPREESLPLGACRVKDLLEKVYFILSQQWLQEEENTVNYSQDSPLYTVAFRSISAKPVSTDESEMDKGKPTLISFYKPNCLHISSKVIFSNNLCPKGN